MNHIAIPPRGFTDETVGTTSGRWFYALGRFLSATNVSLKICIVHKIYGSLYGGGCCAAGRATEQPRDARREVSDATTGVGESPWLASVS